MLLPRTTDRVGLGGEFEEHEEHAMPCKKDIGVVRTIGIDTGKNTQALLGAA